MMKKLRNIIGSAIAALLVSCSVAAASDLSITYIKPVFNPATPRFGEFEIRVGVKNDTGATQEVNLACLYVALTQPGYYFKNEPGVQKQYQVISLQPFQGTEIVLSKRFRSYHPETLGELIVTLVGKDVVKSLALKTAFHPQSQD